MFKERVNSLNKVVSLFFLIFSMAVYLFFAFWDGAVLFNDSHTYIDMSFAREPMYPLLLAFFRSLNEEQYLLFTVVFQSALAAFAGWKLADYLREKLQIHPIYSIVLYMLPIFVSLLNKFFAGRSMMYSNSILSEGISLSLYLIFIYYVLKYLFEDSKRALMGAGILSFLLISTRKQMMVTLILLLCAILWHGIRKAQVKKAFVKVVLCAVIVLGMVRFFDCSYNYLLRGQFMSHSSDNRFLTTMVFYNAQPSDADYIGDEDIRELFLEIYTICDEKGYIGKHAGDGWMNEVSHFGAHYDHIQIDTMWPMIMERAMENITIEDQTLYEKETDRINSVIIRAVLPHQIPELVKCIMNNFMEGMVTTVSQRTTVLTIYAVFIYVIYIVLFIRLFRHVWNARCDKVEQCKDGTLEFAGLTVLGIGFNVALVSMVIFCQARYTIYNMPLFYMSGAVLLYHNFLISKRK